MHVSVGARNAEAYGMGRGAAGLVLLVAFSRLLLRPARSASLMILIDVLILVKDVSQHLESLEPRRQSRHPR